MQRELAWKLGVNWWQTETTRGSFYHRVFHLNSNLMEIWFGFNTNRNSVMATIVCTWHDSCAVLACATFCSDLKVINWRRAKRVSRWISVSKSEKSSVKWPQAVPGRDRLEFPQWCPFQTPKSRQTNRDWQCISFVWSNRPIYTTPKSDVSLVLNVRNTPEALFPHSNTKAWGQISPNPCFHIRPLEREGGCSQNHVSTFNH